jgi:hypothetical protein
MWDSEDTYFDQQSHCLQQIQSNLLVRCQLSQRFISPVMKVPHFIMSLSFLNGGMFNDDDLQLTY